MFCHLYLFRNKVYVPTIARTDAGFYREIEPVEVAEMAQEHGIVEALRRAIERGHPGIPTVRRTPATKPVLLKHTGVRSWSSFEQAALLWIIRIEEAELRILPTRPIQPRGLVEDPGGCRIFAIAGDLQRALGEATRWLLQQASGHGH